MGTRLLCFNFVSGDELTDDERKDVYCVSNINNFKKLKEIMARFNHSSDEED